ncbi:ArsR/SmtB family transcription factor [Nocardiopsis sp. NPDC055879]
MDGGTGGTHTQHPCVSAFLDGVAGTPGQRRGDNARGGARVHIILALRGGESSVSELAERLGRPGHAISQHLAKLRIGRVVACRREGNGMYYSLANEHARKLVADAVFQAEHALEVEPAHHSARAAARQAADQPGKGQT